MSIIDIWVNCPTKNVADKIASALLEKRLIACSNIFADISSAYHWQGKIEHETEVPLLLKSKEVLFDEIVAEIKRIHPYEVPSIIGVPITLVNKDYEEWVINETTSKT